MKKSKMKKSKIKKEKRKGILTVESTKKDKEKKESL